MWVMLRFNRRTVGLLAPGLLAFLITVLSVADMFQPRLCDGVILESRVPGERVVRPVVVGSGQVPLAASGAQTAWRRRLTALRRGKSPAPGG
jgi:hypothetical protein